MSPAFRALALAAFLPALCGATEYSATPASYRTLLPQLQPGDTLTLGPGDYPLLDLGAMSGTAVARITIQGAQPGAMPRITVNPGNPDCCNVVQLTGASYVTLRNLAIHSMGRPGIDGLKAQGTTHHIEVIDCVFSGQGGSQQTVAISTKGTAWNWIVRGNLIVGAGTGMYFGNSDGTAPFVNGLVEHNDIYDTIGYNAQFKFQVPYARPAGLGPGPHRTIIRHNQFHKRVAQSCFPPAVVDGPRPNLLVGGFPTAGFGSEDLYEIYGNYFESNLDGEPLFQGSGRVAVHDNVLAGGQFRGLSLVNHDLPLRRAYVYNNTVVGPPNGITVNGGPLEDSRVSGNLVFATGTPITAPVQDGNIVDTAANAASYLFAPVPGVAPPADFRPRPGMAEGPALDMSAFATHREFALDYAGGPKGGFTFRGALAAVGAPNSQAGAAPKAFAAPDPAGDDDGDGVPNAAEQSEGLNFVVKDNDVFGTARLFAMQQYRDFLGREGDAGGIEFYRAAIDGGTPRAQVIENFFSSPEFQDGLPQCTRLYFSFFGRIPDYAGLLFQVNAYRQGTPLGAIAQNFYNSPEFTATYGALTNDQYINLVYQNVLGRAPDAAGYDYYFTRLESGALTKGEMMIGFSESPEFRQLRSDDVFTVAVYVGTLRRTPEPAGLQFYAAFLAGGGTRSQVIGSFIQAPEYRGRFLY